MMPSSQGRPLAPHVQAAIAKGQGVGVQPKVGEPASGGQMAAHVRDAVLGSLQTKVQGRMESGRLVAAHVQRAMAGTAAPSTVRGTVIQGSFVGGRPMDPSASRSAVAQSRPQDQQPVVARSPWAAQGEFLQLSSGASILRPTAGQQLPDRVRRKMESFFGTSFADVRVHIGAQACAIGALAFTNGSNLFFAPGKYHPHTTHGQRLLGHELAHVVQQRAGRVRNPFGSGIAVVQDRTLEAEADHLGRRAAAHRIPPPPPTSAAGRERAARPDFSSLPPRPAPPKAAVQTAIQMAKLTIPSHMTGEQYITKAALILNPKTKVVVFPGTEMILRDYKVDADRWGWSLVELYNKRHKTKFTEEEQVQLHLHERQLQAAERMVGFLKAGLPRPERVTFVGKFLKAQTKGSTQAVREAYLTDPHQAELRLTSTLLNEQAVSLNMRSRIVEYYKECGLKPREKCVLLWGRKSGEKIGAGPWLDTNEVMLAQMMIVIRLRDPKRKLVLIGDPLDLPGEVDGIKVPSFDVNLVNYWDMGFPGGRDLSAQFYFLYMIKELNDVVAIGTNSGILEIPHLLGVPTIYLENCHLNKRKGLRWQLVAANYEYEYDEEQIKGLERKVEKLAKGGGRRYEDARKELEQAKRHKVVLSHKMRPQLQRFVTSRATELWVDRKFLYGEVRDWLKKGGATSSKREGSHDEFLTLVIESASILGERIGSEGYRQAKMLGNAARKAWIEIRKSQAPFAGSTELAIEALRAMEKALLSHRLTTPEVKRFWETFNYAYVHRTMEGAPDFRAGGRAWLRDTEEIWRDICHRGGASRPSRNLLLQLGLLESPRVRVQIPPPLPMEPHVRHDVRSWLARTAEQWQPHRRW